MSSGPLIKYLVTALETAGCPHYGRGAFECVPCKNTAGGGAFDLIKEGEEERGKIRLCEDAIQSTTHLQDTMAHELIHAFDHCRSRFDMNSCRQRACSEIRAANLSGECKWTREVLRGNWKIKAQHVECVKRRAKLSLLAATDACKDLGTVEATIASVWDSCYNDTEPFIDIP